MWCGRLTNRCVGTLTVEASSFEVRRGSSLTVGGAISFSSSNVSFAAGAGALSVAGCVNLSNVSLYLDVGGESSGEVVVAKSAQDCFNVDFKSLADRKSTRLNSSH